jgi:putative transposase
VKRLQFSEEQTAFALKQQELGASVDEICRKMGTSEATSYNWKKKYSGLEPSELRRLKHLEEESAKLKCPVAELSVDKAMLQDVVKGKLWRQQANVNWSTICAAGMVPASARRARR